MRPTPGATPVPATPERCRLLLEQWRSQLQLSGREQSQLAGQHRALDRQLERLRHGLELDDRPLKPAQVSWSNEDQLRVVLREGRKRQIRRMCEQVGLKVVGLKRVRIGSVVLGKLPAGKWRYLRDDERF